MLRYTDNNFMDHERTTIGVDVKTKILDIDDEMVKITIWDTAGQERLRTVTPNYYRDAQGAILMYDVTRRATLYRLESWLNELKIYGTSDSMVKMIVGNKIDQSNREISTKEGSQFANAHNMLFVETSARTSEGVKDAFEAVVRKIMEIDREQNRFRQPDPRETVNLNRQRSPPPPQSSSCC